MWVAGFLHHGPSPFLSFLIAIAGLITSFFGKGNLKIIGLALNAAALVIAVIWIIVVIVMVVADM